MEKRKTKDRNSMEGRKQREKKNIVEIRGRGMYRVTYRERGRKGKRVNQKSGRY